MKARFAIRVLLIFSLVVSACKSTKIDNPNQPTTISFGTYGGFAGSYTEYVITENGKTFMKTKFDGKLDEMGPIKAEDFTRFMRSLKKFKATKYIIQDPGNQTFFIRLKENGQLSSEWLWGGNAHEPSAELVSMYRDMFALCKDNFPIK